MPTQPPASKTDVLEILNAVKDQLTGLHRLVIQCSEVISSMGQPPVIQRPAKNQAAPIEPLLVDAETAAKMINTSTRRLWDLTDAGLIPRVPNGRKISYRPVDLRKYVDDLAVGAEG